ncbi:hypothetical protein N0V93_009110 [Gnomoniopsis smithogilvyi]|uniref:Uncharacterized protein n=1 Tax=Gnomoniopsis smithogilvyi TaxID=1191159 RepID=A0A9W9CTD8_9PEZI|nr:hypothetical protein N0V93_009110 [Gnomoniopsis smithogilvyi]
MEITEIILQFRARLAGTQSLASLLSITKDCRVTRVIALLSEIPYHGQVLPPCAEEVLQICADDPMRYKGFHPRLLLLDEELSKATDFLVESSKRILLYLEHIKATGSKLPEAIRMLTQSTVREQMGLATDLCQKARSAMTEALTKPPGPAPMPFDDLESMITVQPSSARGLFDGEPLPTGENYDARWDPDFKMPGSQHGKFLKFPGPYFAPDTSEAIFDHFLLSETAADLLDNFNRKFSNCVANFEAPRRAQDEEDVAMLEALGEHIGLELAYEGNYDLDSICLYTRTRPKNVSTTAGPYISCWQVRKSRIGTGVWALEDLNRILVVHETGRQGAMVSPMDTGCQIFFDRRISRDRRME